MVCWAATKKPWTWDCDRKAYCRVDETKTVHWELEETKLQENGYGSYLCMTDPEMLMCLIECVADANPRTLANSLSVISSPELWTFVPGDMEKIHPNMILLILRKFMVRGIVNVDQNGKQFLVPISYGMWMEHFVPEVFPEEIRCAILGNANLLLYIKGLIEQCQLNPMIINKMYNQQP